MKSGSDASVSASTDESQAADSSALNLLTLQKSLSGLERNFESAENSQGFIGRSIDWTKNTLGASAHSDFLVGRLWSHVIDSDRGSEAVRKSFNTFRAGLNAYPPAADTAQAANAAGLDGLRQSVAGYKESQSSAVNLVGDTAAFGAMLLSRRPRSVIEHMFEGALAKSAVKYVDGPYSNVADDVITGAAMGNILPVGRYLGRLGHSALSLGLPDIASRAAVRSGLTYAVECGFWGYAADTSSHYMANRALGLGRDQALVHSFGSPLKSPGTVGWFVLGGAVGVFGGRVSQAISSSYRRLQSR